MLVSEVALGRCLELFEHNTELHGAPEGYDSVHGVKASSDVKSQFKVKDSHYFKLEVVWKAFESHGNYRLSISYAQRKRLSCTCRNVKIWSHCVRNLSGLPLALRSLLMVFSQKFLQQLKTTLLILAVLGLGALLSSPTLRGAI